MGLLLEVISDQSSALGAARQFFVTMDCTIGREGDWVLDAEGVSRDHAHIVYLNGLYFVEGVGRNRIALNGRWIENFHPQKLNENDVVALDEYQIRVRYADQAPVPPPDVHPSPGRTERVPEHRSPNGRGILEITPDVPRPSGTELPEPAHNAIDELLRRAMEGLVRSNSGAQGPAMPRATDSTPSKQECVKAPVGAVSPDRTPPDGDAFSEMMRGLGLEDARLDARAARELGAILRIVVEGTIKLIKTGADIRAELRLPGSRIGNSGNNPLKYSANLKDALFRLLIQRDDGYMDPSKAFEAAFQEMQAHEYAMQLAVREAFRYMLRQLSPESLEKQFDKTVGRHLLPAMAKAKLWELYAESMQSMATDPDAYSILFGKELARVYEREFSARRYKTSQ